MPKVELPRADWDAIVSLLEELQEDGWLVASLINDINRQVNGQEY